jgi:hypothetical protein
MKSVWMLLLLTISSVALANGRKAQVEPRPSYVFRNVCYGEAGKNFSRTIEFKVYEDHRIMAVQKNGFQQYFGESNFDTFLRHNKVCLPSNSSSKTNIDAAAKFHNREGAFAQLKAAQARLDNLAMCHDTQRSCSRSVDYQTRYSPGTITSPKPPTLGERMYKALSDVGYSATHNVPGAL